MQDCHTLRLEKITKSYALPLGEKIVVLENIDFILRQKELVSLIGASGCGKSTFLHIVGLLDLPTSGNIYLDDVFINMEKDLYLTRLRAKYFGFVYQKHYLLAGFTVLENVLLPQNVSSQGPTKQSRQYALHLLERMELHDHLSRYPMELSGGEQQRVAIARALTNKPAFLFADEPTGNLDPKTAETVFILLKELVEKENVGVCLATHDMMIAQETSHQYLVAQKNVVYRKK